MLAWRLGSIMGLRGPVPKPTAAKIAAGNPGRRQLNEEEPIPPAGEISAPDWLGDRARTVWNAVAPTCVTMKTLTTADVLPFARYCECFARWLELNEFMIKKGPTGTTYAKRSKDEKGKSKLDYVYELPQASEWRQLFGILQRFEDRFGLNAAARSRIRVQLTAGVVAQTPQQKRDEEKRDYFRGGGPRPPRLVSESDEEPRQKARGKGATKDEAGASDRPA